MMMNTNKNFSKGFIFFYGLPFMLMLFFGCVKEASSDYYPPVISVGFEDTSAVTISNDQPNPDGGPDSTYVRLYKIVSNVSNNSIGVDVYFNFFSIVTNKVDTSAINNYIRLMNPIISKDSLNADGSYWGSAWDCSRANISLGLKQTAVMIRTIDNTGRNGGEKSFLLKIIPDRNIPKLYEVDTTRSTKRITIKNN